MSQLGQWLFDQQKGAIRDALDRAMPYTAEVATSGISGITVINPLTGEVESEILIPAGFRTDPGQRMLILPLGDGSRMALPFGQTPVLTRRGRLIMDTDDALALAIRTAAGGSVMRVDTVLAETQIVNGTDLAFYTGALGTEKGRIDAATGLITGLYTTDARFRGTFVDLRTDITPTTATNNSTSSYVEHASFSLALPAAGTWDVSVVSIANYKNNAANAGARSYTDIGGTTGTDAADTTATANNLLTLTSMLERAGLSGTITVKTMYRAESAGTASARDVVWIVTGERVS